MPHIIGNDSENLLTEHVSEETSNQVFADKTNAVNLFCEETNYQFVDDEQKLAEMVSEEATNQFLASVIMVLRQQIQTILKSQGITRAKFENQIRKLYGNMPDATSYNAYIDVETCSKSDMMTFARVFSRIDRVEGVHTGINDSYALHIKITTGGDKNSYDAGFIAKHSGRFAVGHDLGDVFLNLDFLIDNAEETNYSDVDIDMPRHYLSDFFSYILSDLRDFKLLDLGKHFKFEPAFNDYTSKIECDIDENSKKIEFQKIFETAEKLHESSWFGRKSMAYSVIALRKIIKEHINSAIDSERGKLIEELKDCIDDEDKLKKIKEKLNEVDKKYPRICIDLFNKKNETFNELSLDCYTRKDANTSKKLYCFEIYGLQSLGEVDMCKQICCMLGCIYWGFEFFVKKLEEVERYNNTLTRVIHDTSLRRQKINTFSDILYDLRERAFSEKIGKLKQEKMLYDRLKGYRKEIVPN